MFLRETNTSTIFTRNSFNFFCPFCPFERLCFCGSVLQKDCDKSTFFTHFPLKGTECWQGPKYKVKNEKVYEACQLHRHLLEKWRGRERRPIIWGQINRHHPFHVLYSLEGILILCWNMHIQCSLQVQECLRSKPALFFLNPNTQASRSVVQKHQYIRKYSLTSTIISFFRSVRVLSFSTQHISSL